MSAILKANPYHAADGKFSSATGKVNVTESAGTGMSFTTLAVQNDKGAVVGELQMSEKDGANTYQIRESRVDEDARGAGHGKALYRAAFAQASKKNMSLTSDLAVSDSADRVWQSLQKEGYPVTRNPGAKFENGKWYAHKSLDIAGIDLTIPSGEPMWTFSGKAAKKQDFMGVLKANPYHDGKGRFAPKDGAGSKVTATGSFNDKKPLSDHFAKYDDPKTSVDTVLAKFTPAERAEIALATKRSQEAPTSKSLFTDKTGEYTAERQKLHNAIVDDYLNAASIRAATPPKGEAPTFIVLGGRGGSGKSSFTYNDKKDEEAKVKEFDSKKFLILDSDAIKDRLKPPYAGWNAFSVHEESSDIFEHITSEAKRRGLNLLHDTTLRGKSVESTIEQFKGDGYKVEGHYMFVPRQISAERAVGRYLGRNAENRGRLVPVDVILGNTENEKNFDYLKKHFDKWSAYDNQGTAPKLISRGKKK